MYIFAEIKDEELVDKMDQTLDEDKFTLCSSDVSPIEGFVFDDEELEEFKQTIGYKNYNRFVELHDLPQKYKECIDEFICDYWDGDWTFEYGDMAEW